jgi:hypothetical protein
MQLYPSRSGILAEFARKKGSKDKKKRKRSLADNLFGTTTAGKLVRGGLLAGGALVAGRKFIPRKPLPDSTINNNNPIGNLPASGGTSGRSYVKQETYKPGYKPNFVERPVPPPKPLTPNKYLDDLPDTKNISVVDDLWADTPKVVKTNKKGTGTTVNQRKQEAWRENKGRNNNSKRKR